MLRVTANTGLLKEITDCLSILTEEVKLSWGEKGLSVSVVDGSHVALLSAVVSDVCFETYEIEPVEIGLELGKLRDLLNLPGLESNLVEIDYDENVGALNVRIGEVHRILRGLDTGSMQDPKLPVLEFDSSATISSEKLSRALRAAKLVGELADLSIDSKELRISVTVEAGEGVNVRFEAGELSELVCAAPTQSTYSLQYLEVLTRKLAAGLAQDVQVQFQDRYPLCLQWNSNDGGAEWKFYLAPRVSNE